MDIEPHSFAEMYAKDFEAYGNPRVALNRAGEPAKSRGSVHRLAVVINVESLAGYRTRLTLESGRTMTMQDHRWVLAEHSFWRRGE
jgi:hypothetical protein